MRDILAENKKDIWTIGIGAVLFAAGMIIEHFTDLNFWISAILFIAAYLILGMEIIVEAVKNLFHGHLFDENFLMALATLAAFAIGEFSEAVGVMLFYRIGEFFEDVAVDRSQSQIMEAADMRPDVVNRISGEEEQVIPAEEALVGDLLRIRPGDRIPLDGVIVEGVSRLDTSPVTGESVPVGVTPGSEVLSGCVNEQGVLKMKVTKPLSESMVTRILNSVQDAAENKPRLDRFITRFARVYTPIVVILAVLVAVIPSFITGQWYYWIYTAITFLVISCPCALVLSVPLAFFAGIGSASRSGILFKGGISIEALTRVKAVVMDKTGTVTKGNFDVQQVLCLGDYAQDEILRLAADTELDSTHPIGMSIVSAAKSAGLPLERAKSVEELSGKGIRARFPEGEVLVGNDALMEMEHVPGPWPESSGYGTEAKVAINGRPAGVIRILDEIKEDAKDAVSRMEHQGLVTAMLTGDEQGSAQAVKNETGIDEAYARLLPQDKVEYLHRIRNAHGPVLFVGDGINDAPVLAGADVGAAMGSGADAAIEAADVVYMNPNVEAIPRSVSIARHTNRIAMQNVVFSLVVKALIMILGLIGFANMWLAVFADTGVAMLCVLNSVRILWKK